MDNQEAIKTLRELRRETNDSWYEAVYDMAISALEAEPCEDTISRQAAIDAIGSKSDEIYKTKQAGATFPHNDFFQGMAYAEDIVKQLPSAEPETPMQIGWICPVCGRGLSPLTSVCPCNNGKGWEITC